MVVRLFFLHRVSILRTSCRNHVCSTTVVKEIYRRISLNTDLSLLGISRWIVFFIIILDRTRLVSSKAEFHPVHVSHVAGPLTMTGPPS